MKKMMWWLGVILVMISGLFVVVLVQVINMDISNNIGFSVVV